LKKTIMFTKKLLPAIVLAMASAAALAQQPTNAGAQPGNAGPQSSAQQAQIEHLNHRMSQAATEVTQGLDKNKAGEIWDNASQIAKKAVTRDDFVRHVTAERKALGAPVARHVINVSYRRGDGKEIPAGIYANVTFATTFSDSKKPMTELVTYHSDDDHVWRVAGYVLSAQGASKG